MLPMFSSIKRSWNLFSPLLMLLFAALALLAFRAYRNMKADRDRLKQNQTQLLNNGAADITEMPNGRSRASVASLTLRPDEFRRSADSLVKIARQVGIRPSRISEASTAATSMQTTIETPIYRSSAVPDSSVCLSWSDPWVSLSGCVTDSLFRGIVSTTDTLDIIVHRVPKRFLFFRFGCREVRMDIISRNPHTRLTYARYYKLVK